MIEPRYTLEEVQRLGEAAFEREIAARLRGENLRHFVAIDVDTAEYEVNASVGVAMRRMLDRHPEAQLWIRRVGSPVAHSFGPRWVLQP